MCIGKLFVMDYYVDKLDLMMMVKSFVGGMLFLGVVGNVNIMDVFVLGGFGGIYVGNLLVVVVVYVVFNIIDKELFCECVN